jgi:glycosyltransferase involved in cell wall biosynthesis
VKIAMVSEHASPLAVVGEVDAGGQNVHVAMLSQALAAHGHEVTVYTRRDDRDLDDRVTFTRGVTVEHLAAGPPRHIRKDALLPYIPALSDALALRLAQDPPAVVHAHFWMSGLAAVPAAAAVGVPVVQTFHALGTVKRRWQGSDDSSPPDRIAAETELIRNVDRIVATCTDEVRELVSLGARRAQVDVVPCGVDATRFCPDGPVAPRSRRPRLLAIGRLVPRKGIDDAITALAALPEAELLVAGGPPAHLVHDDPEAARLLARARELGVASRVHLIGQVPRAELPALIRSADLVVCLPWYEPFGIVPLEAMACGVPVIGTAVGGLLDTVIDGVTGALLPPHRPDLVADAAQALLGAPLLRAAYAHAGVERALRHYSWERVARATERSYLRSVIDARRPDADCEEVG